MAVTLNYTSKGLIDAIQRQLAQQKKEGKISGDISYKNITKCEFWETLKKINDKHDKKTKIYHQKSYGCEDKGKPADWRKTVVVYGSAKLEDDEWEQLVNAMGLQLNKEEPKAEEPIQPLSEEVVTPQGKEEQQAPVQENKKEFAMPVATMAVLMTELQKSGYKNNVTATKLIQTELNCNVVLTPDKELKIYNAEGKELTTKDENGNIIFSNELRQALDAQLLKQASLKAEAEKTTETETKTDPNTETSIKEDDEK